VAINTMVRFISATSFIDGGVINPAS
jgi:hypothetical protein